MKCYEITVFTDHAKSETAAALLCGITGEGVSIVDRQDLSEANWDYAEKNLASSYPDEVLVRCYCGSGELEAVLEKIRSGLGEVFGHEPKTETRLVDETDWADEWKKNYFPVHIGGLVICPLWLDDGKENNVLIDTGLAFGTGQHETTALVAELMQTIDIKNKTVLDIGCGSGVLGIAAAKLGAREVVFADNDPQAAETAKENIKHNNLRAKTAVVCGDLTDKIQGAFDIILANLTAPILIKLRKQIDRVIKKGSEIRPAPSAAEVPKLILSGILNEYSEEIESAYAPFTLAEKRVKGEWTALLFEVLG